LNDNDLKQRIQAYSYEDLRILWAEVENNTLNDQLWLPGKALEYLIVRAFELEGSAVQYPFRVYAEGREVEQIDGVLYIGSLAFIIETKDRQYAVDIEPIAKLRNQLLRRPPGVMGIIFSRKGFTEPAVKLASYVSPQSILLWSGEEIAYALSKQRMVEALIRKYRYCVEHALPDYNILELEF
jgi:hypothetical protein